MNNIYFCYQKKKPGCYVVAKDFGEARKIYLSSHPIYDTDQNTCITNIFKRRVQENTGIIEEDSELFKKYKLKVSDLRKHSLMH